MQMSGQNVKMSQSTMQSWRKTKNIEMLILKSGWSDLGSWNAISEVISRKKVKSDKPENVHYFDCEDTMLRAENSSQHIVGLGLENILAIAMPDAVLITQKIEHKR